ncbi:LOW QUALITY PROTEIN: hypothetical protein PanWU01x14_006760, partial [Parasponia andersonii]
KEKRIQKVFFFFFFFFWFIFEVEEGSTFNPHSLHNLKILGVTSLSGVHYHGDTIPVKQHSPHFHFLPIYI